MNETETAGRQRAVFALGGVMRLIALFVAALAVAGCAESIMDSPEKVAAARYVSDEAPYVALVSMVNVSNDKGAHSAILVNGSQVALYDPAGTFAYETVPERNDVLYGITPRMKEAYEWYHARESTYVVEQKLNVSRDFADAVIARMEAEGPSPKLHCGIHAGRVLQSFERFAHVPSSYYPGDLMRAFGAIEGVETRKVFQNDVGQNIEFRRLAGAAGQI